MQLALKRLWSLTSRTRSQRGHKEFEVNDFFINFKVAFVGDRDAVGTLLGHCPAHAPRSKTFTVSFFCFFEFPHAAKQDNTTQQTLHLEIDCLLGVVKFQKPTDDFLNVRQLENAIFGNLKLPWPIWIMSF